MSKTLYETKKNGVYISFEALDVDYIPEKGATVVGFTIGDRGGLISTKTIGFAIVALETGHFDVLKGIDSNLSAFRNDLCLRRFLIFFPLLGGYMTFIC